MKTPPFILARFRLSRRAYYADFLITPPIMLWLAWLSFRTSDTLSWCALVTAGWMVWTLYEYVLHALVLHGWPLFRDLHGLHHREPLAYIALHPLATIVINLCFWLIFGWRSSAFMVGFSLGYIVYSTLHTVLHYSPLAPRLFPALHRRHLRHHKAHTVNFGVTCGFWDRVFGTEFQGGERLAS